ncbi:MAG: hypothetical protein M1838_005525 [Thelocarpon superellum]|nr:MAG: hypothetical protein M1838_005525 [Thelocarpon superellum]
MEGLFNQFFGGSKAAPSPVPSADDADFADFAGAPDPTPVSILPVTASAAGGQPAFATGSAGALPYTKWYRVWERTSPKDFVQEAFVIPFIILAIIFHLWGSRTNRRIAKKWMVAHAPILQQEYAVVGFGGRRAPTIDEVESEGLAKAMISDELELPKELLKEKTAQEWATYATGRMNAAFTDITLTMLKRYNPLALGAEYGLSFFFDSFPTPVQRMDAVTYAFDGKEAELVPVSGGKQGQEIAEQRRASSSSTYDGFVWAVVHKDIMKQLREERYDVSLTTTRDNPKLPTWATVMTESAEVTDALLTPQLIEAVKVAGELLEYLIVSDQPLDKPTKLEETVPKKRVFLSLRVPSSADFEPTLPIFQHFIRLPDFLVSSAHFRPEALRKVRQTREEQIRKLQRLEDEEKAEERSTKRDKEKKEKRDAKLNGLNADEQRKYLEKEREKEQRRNQKKTTLRG